MMAHPLSAPFEKPYEFAGDYSGVFSQHRWMGMDERHIYVLHHLLSFGGFRLALEIGCCYGASTTAFVEALKADPELRVMLCDPWISPNLMKVTKHADHKRVRFFKGKSWDLLAKGVLWDFVCVDGDHDLASVRRETVALLRLKPRMIVAHDTHAQKQGYERCEGAEHLLRKLKESDYVCFCDSAKRDGERTDRGLTIACREEDRSLVMDALAKYCPDTTEVYA